MPKEHLCIAVAQLNYKLCDFECNREKIQAAALAASDADLIVFSELCLSGYHPLDLVESADFLSRQQRALSQLLAFSRSIKAALVIGLVTANPGPGKSLRNTLMILQAGQVRLTYHKQLLPTYDVFDERRYFEPGAEAASIYEIRGHKIGLLICEDAWNDEVTLYANNPIAHLAGQRIDLLININASPAHLGKREQRHEIFGLVAKRYGFALLYSNQVGGNDQLVYDGASFALNRSGELVHELPLYEEATTKLHFTGDFVAASRDHSRSRSPLTPSEFFYAQALIGLRDYAAKVGFESVIVGSSGGIDSALTIALACDALGANAVHAVTMPSRHSSTASVDDSVTLCASLGVALQRHPIASIVSAFESEFDKAFNAPLRGLAAENLQARVRGTILMEASNQFGHLVLSTGNKSEMSIGYATLYGDMNGGLNLIGDVYKTEVFDLVRHFNQMHGGDLIPKAVLTKAPSAELAPGQKDSDSLPPYEILDVILKDHIEGPRLRPDEAARVQSLLADVRAREGDGLLRKVCGMVARAEFKRRQAPPIVRMRERAFGAGRQMPIAADYCD